jgi:cytochrome c-type biogenesis protein CcmH/NrfG
METAMSLGQIVVISGIVFAFAIFAVALAWGDYQTQRMNPQTRNEPRRADKVVAFEVAKKARTEPHHEDGVVSGV